jgi:hypothetical protein
MTIKIEKNLRYDRTKNAVVATITQKGVMDNSKIEQDQKTVLVYPVGEFKELQKKLNAEISNFENQLSQLKNKIGNSGERKYSDEELQEFKEKAEAVKGFVEKEQSKGNIKYLEKAKKDLLDINRILKQVPK